MEIKTVEEINQYIGTTVNPLDNPDTVYELYSVPSFESQHPEIIKGEDIGSSKITVEDGDVLVCKINPRINRVWVVKWHTSYQLLASSEWIVIRNCDIDSDYLKWYFSSPTFRNLLVSQVAGIGGSLTRAQPKQVAKYPVPLVGKEEQRRIASLLDRVSELIAKRRAQLEKLDLLVKARFVEMFGDPVTNPYGYPVHQLSDYIEFLTSGSRGWAQYFSDEGEYFITIKNVKNCRITLDDVQYIKPPDNAEAKRTKVQEGDLLISITADLGRTGVVTKEIADHGAYINQHLTCIRLNQKAVLPLYVAYYMESDAGKGQFQAKNQSAVKAGLNFNSINTLHLMVPPKDQQGSFIDFVERTDKSKFTIQQSLDKLETLKKALMQQYFK